MDNNISPLPWKVQHGEALKVRSATDECVLIIHQTNRRLKNGTYRKPWEETEANAQYIVEAVNNYQALKEMVDSANQTNEAMGKKLLEMQEREAKLVEALEVIERLAQVGKAKHNAYENIARNALKGMDSCTTSGYLLPYEVQVNHIKFSKGVKLDTFIKAATRWHTQAQQVLSQIKEDE